ncbi:hypothetical protein PYCCODRAFT_1188575 [Trametes coccinea BRFM310]|uniref:Uncharacterized protein n=1 Tax=Trametes coccinea (strain BRFM310) TaxID=1353009 RepID=A0A1Y2I7T9_TRAC3|nr:hypothetical protein PYCCODRAFT_1188575 [Trametes coccinea BRFM310]
MLDSIFSLSLAARSRMLHPAPRTRSFMLPYTPQGAYPPMPGSRASTFVRPTLVAHPRSSSFAAICDSECRKRRWASWPQYVYEPSLAYVDPAWDPGIDFLFVLWHSRRCAKFRYACLLRARPGCSLVSAETTLSVTLSSATCLRQSQRPQICGSLNESHCAHQRKCSIRCAAVPVQDGHSSGLVHPWFAMEVNVHDCVMCWLQ